MSSSRDSHPCQQPSWTFLATCTDSDMLTLSVVVPQCGRVPAPGQTGSAALKQTDDETWSISPETTMWVYFCGCVAHEYCIKMPGVHHSMFDSVTTCYHSSILPQFVLFFSEYIFFRSCWLYCCISSFVWYLKTGCGNDNDHYSVLLILMNTGAVLGYMTAWRVVYMWSLFFRYNNK